ncbi:site-specific integrase [Microcoleus sp. herbarium2]|uniref:site-specific integrase n=1 Tax=Microcoleus sp. herbarium2 TaxID=3055433 RepID=UPI002FD74C75
MQTLTPELRKLLTQLSQQLQPDPDRNPPLLEIWDLWVQTLDLSVETAADHYYVTRRQIAKAGNPLAADTDWFLGNPLAPQTYNARLRYLRNMAAWAVTEGLLSANPWLKVKPRKKTKEIIKPFSQGETVRIIAGFEKSYPAWVPFTKFLFLSGCRMSEAIGLLWKHVDFERGEICICESLSRKPGTNYERVRKSTKTGSVRFLKINSELTKVFEKVSPASKNPDGLVFQNPTGTNSVDCHNFRKRWTKVLAAANIPYRRPHIIRHSFASHAIEQGCPLTGVAYLLGHSDTRMVATTYGHLINRPSLPQILGGSHE